jgi:hypothetical protein
MYQMSCLRRPSMADIRRDWCRHYGIMHVFARLMDVSTGFYRVRLTSERTLLLRAGVTET